MITGLTYIVLATDDLPRARRFFVEKLGLAPEAADDAFVQFPAGSGTTWGIAQEEQGGAVMVFFEVEDADQACDAWQERGVDVLTAPHDEPYGRTFAFRDPDGRVLHAWVPRRPAA